MIGERLKILRKNKGISQRELGDIIGLKKSTVSLYENNKTEPNDEIKIIIARYFNVSADYLIGVIDEEVCYYSGKKFLIYPDEMSNEEEILINEFIHFIYCRRNPLP